MHIKNISDGPRGLWVEGSVVMLAPGETRDLEALGGDLAAAKRSGWFEVEGGSDADDEPARAAVLANLSDDELRTFLGERGVRADGRWSRERLLAEAEKVQA